ncbi:saccharopine dehydrogenase NADP-binding domain-containing protein [Tabrizicola sp.]|uniref:saccharopine dehydrogenase family protein n=1 Tax=Tabrizicola sp. TaxID=2005166 RepID=UPI003F37E4CF
MKLLIIGAGVVGQHIAATAAKLPPFTQVTIADRDPTRAQAVAKSIDGQWQTIDALDFDTVSEQMRQADVTVSAVGPSTRFGLPMLRAAIAVGGRYLDICDDPRPMMAMLDLDAEARKTGATAIVGAGASPGVASLLAVEAASRLDSVQRILTGWGDNGESEDDAELEGEASAALEHWVEQACGQIPIVKDGRIVDAAPLASVDVDYPGIGMTTARSIGHPEPVTLLRRFPQLRDSINLMDFPSYIFACLEDAVAAVAKGASFKEAAELLRRQLHEEPGDTMLSKKAMRYAWHATQDRIIGKLWLPPLWALAEGMRDGRPTRVGASLSGTFSGGVGPTTGIPAAIFASMLASGDLTSGPGVHPPEMAILPAAFFERLRPFLRSSDGAVPGVSVQIAADPATAALLREDEQVPFDQQQGVK